MTPPPSAETAIVQTLFATINHNLPVMVYVAGILFSIMLLLLKPNRRLVLFLVGFALLAFNFEYVKHIQDPLLAQTQTSIESTGYQTMKGRRTLDLVFDDFLPFATYLGGWSLLFLGILTSTYAPKFPLAKHKEDEEGESSKLTV